MATKDNSAMLQEAKHPCSYGRSKKYTSRKTEQNLLQWIAAICVHFSGSFIHFLKFVETFSWSISPVPGIRWKHWHPRQYRWLSRLTGCMICARLYVQNAFTWYTGNLDREIESAYLAKCVLWTAFSILSQFLLHFLYGKGTPPVSFSKLVSWLNMRGCLWVPKLIIFCTLILKCFL